METGIARSIEQVYKNALLEAKESPNFMEIWTC